jgi:hypothetical protein
VNLDTKWWISLIVSSVIALGVGFKAEIASQFTGWWAGVSGWWTALTAWRFLFWGCILWIAGMLVARFVVRPISQILEQIKSERKAHDEVVANLVKTLLSVNERLQAVEMKVGIYPGDKKTS